VIVTVVAAAMMAIPQYTVVRLLTGRPSFAGAMWIPVTVGAWLAFVLATPAFAESIANALLSVGVIRTLMPGPFPFLSLISGIELITLAALLGLAQGLLLGRVFAARSASGLWFAANLLAALVMWIVIEIRDSGSSRPNQTAIDSLLPTVFYGFLYAAITGVALVAAARRRRKGAAPAPSTAPAPAAR